MRETLLHLTRRDPRRGLFVVGGEHAARENVKNLLKSCKSC